LLIIQIQSLIKTFGKLKLIKIKGPYRTCLRTSRSYNCASFIWFWIL